MSSNVDAQIQNIYGNYNMARENLVSDVREILNLPVSTGVGFYFEVRDGNLPDAGIVLWSEGSPINSYSIICDWFEDDPIFTDSRLMLLKDRFKDFVSFLASSVFVHEDENNRLSRVPLWMTMLWDEDGEIVKSNYATSFGYSFDKSVVFNGVRPATIFGGKSFVHLWADYLNSNGLYSY